MNNNITLLYAEDNEEVLENITFLLKRYVSKVYTAQDGQEALDKYFQYKPDIIISDISMPRINGLDFAKLIRREDKYIPIIIMSAYHNEDHLSSAIDIGVSSYVQKPFTLEVLKQSLKKAIDEQNFFKKNEKFEENFSLINHNISMLHTNKEFMITEITSAFAELTGYTKQELLNNNPSLLASGKTQKSTYQDLYKHICIGQTWHGELENKAKNGTYYWIALTITPIFDKDSNIKGFSSIYTDISKIKEAQEKANKDALTSLYNRTMFDEITQNSINLIQRHQINLTYIMIDVDNFKKYNDKYGHQNGDKALQMVASILEKHTQREQDYAFRIGGEEFTLITIGLNEEKSLHFANKIKEDIFNLKIPHKYNENHSFLSVSIGLYVSTLNNTLTKEDIYMRADQALYTSKKNGRNRVTLAE